MTLMKRFSPLALGLLLFFVGVSPARALTLIVRNFDELVTRADTVFKGTVTAMDSHWVGEGERRHIATFVTFRVEETYKGASVSEQTLRFFGGAVGDEAMDVPEMPKFAVGQTAVLFVVNNGKQFCPLVGIAQGRFHVVKDQATGRERIFTDDQSPVVNTTEIGQVDADGVPRLRRYAHTSAQAMSAADFRAEILGKVAALPR